MADEPDSPRGTLKLRTITMPSDLNALGTVFGGWIMAQFDMAAGMAANVVACGPATTVAVKELRLLKPLRAAQEIEFFVELVSTGRTSMHFNIQLWACSYENTGRVLCGDALFIMVALDEAGRPRQINQT